MSNSQGDSDRPVVMIVGAGIGGLMMGLLLEQINIPYHIFERAAEVKPLGSAIAFSGSILVVIEQLGIYKELIELSKQYDAINFYDGVGNMMGGLSLETAIETLGYRSITFSRPDFYETLRKRIPESKISFKKKILDIEEKDGKVSIHCSDSMTYEGDILIGADGAYSRVRQSMYKEMDEQGLLPKVDLEEFSIGFTTIVGVTKPLDAEKYPMLKKDICQFNQVIYDGNSNCYIFPISNNRISWGFGTQLSQSTSKEKCSNNSEWNAEDSASTLNAFRDYPNPLGGTMGDMFDATPTEYISKVNLEEKLFETWHHGRTVLIGDAIHKFHPAAGKGASNAVFDAVALANALYFMKDKSAQSITQAFKDYHDYRFEHAKMSYDESHGMSKLLNGQTFFEKLFRKFFLNYIPSWVFNSAFKKSAAHKPQVAWLPLLNRGTFEADLQQWEGKQAVAI